MRLPPPTKTEKKTKVKKKLKERPPARPQDSEPAIMQPDQDLPPAYAPAVRFYADIANMDMYSNILYGGKFLWDKRGF